ncbi:DUF3991 and toprim domain-containing protein [Bradyrhizobium sp. BR13661]|jgi:hypothetical protein|uniref:DUF3991 and toprim domain-containing protein n=1 Tax=Bradyrhizobium sp. BR13661 TaxID=2940622 RepID=UPI002476C966|nr:DUF3991 and toprim domain-containing protein [Bradyrhizobium sp. BR13661]MDH6261694.1 hypothetical protein [Bradyrhizobium sp. BR13661]
MEKKDIEELRSKVVCAAVLEREGWKIDLKESTRRALKYRSGADIIIVIHEGRGWFDPLSPAKGDVFDLAKHFGANGFPEACDRVAALVGFVVTLPVWKRAPKPAATASIASRWSRRRPPRPGSATWNYLAEQRGIPDSIIAVVVARGGLREGLQGSMWAAHDDLAGRIIGWEERGPHWRGFATGGTKELFRFGPTDAERICITEAAIDAMSLAAIEVQRSHTLYVSTGGGWSPATEQAIRCLAERANVRLVAATDNNRQGDVYAERIRKIAGETGIECTRSRPRAGDWNEDLRGLLGGPAYGLLATIQ